MCLYKMALLFWPATSQILAQNCLTWFFCGNQRYSASFISHLSISVSSSVGSSPPLKGNQKDSKHCEISSEFIKTITVVRLLLCHKIVSQCIDFPSAFAVLLLLLPSLMSQWSLWCCVRPAMISASILSVWTIELLTSKWLVLCRLSLHSVSRASAKPTSHCSLR